MIAGSIPTRGITYQPHINYDENEIYAVNTVAHEFMKRPIKINKDIPLRIYLINVTEFDPINSFHIHGNFFDYYDHGTVSYTHLTLPTILLV